MNYHYGQVGLTQNRSEEDSLLFEMIAELNPHSNTLYIIDARPKVNAMANQAKGSGYENIQGIYPLYPSYLS